MEIIKYEDGKIKIETFYDFTNKHKEALINLVKEGIYEHRGGSTEEDRNIHSDLECMKLAADLPDAWHLSWTPTEEGERIVSQIQFNLINIL